VAGRYFFRIDRSFLPLSGGTVTGETLFTGNLSAGTIYSGSTELSEIIRNESQSVSNQYLPLSGGTGGEYLFTGSTTASTIIISNDITPELDDNSDLGSPFRRFRSLNTVNGVATNFTATTKMQTAELILGNTSVTEDNIVLSGNCIDGGDW